MQMVEQESLEKQRKDLPIKGIRDGLLITVSHLHLREVQPALDHTLSNRRAFLRGSKVAVDVGHHQLDETMVRTLQQLFERLQMTLWAILSAKERTKEAARTVGLATRLPGTATDLNGNSMPMMATEQEKAPEGEAEVEPNGLLLQETIRSGRSVYFEGHIVVMGDVNPGAEIMATGNVIVWGRLRGLVHAGCSGDASATVCALDLTPTQLRIADQIAITPQGRRGRRTEPEQASIQDGQIVAELWTAQ